MKLMMTEMKDLRGVVRNKEKWDIGLKGAW